MEIFSVEGLNFTYPKNSSKALDNVNLHIEEGDFTVICGETGCGKTTLLKILKKELRPHGELSGDIKYFGENLDLSEPKESACGIGYVFQTPQSQITTDKVWHELAFGLENMGLSNSVIRRRVGEIASFFGIEHMFRSKTENLSGGQMQLLNLASVMVMQPKALLLDEPTSQLDPIAASELIFTLQKINRELGLTVLMAEHRLEDVFPASDKVVVMDRGKILLHDTPKLTVSKLQEKHPGHPMLSAIPSAARVFTALDAKGECPLTVKEGRKFLSENFSNEIQPEKPENKRDERKLSIELSDVWFRYERQAPDIMRGVDLKVYEGETYCILGGNGTGKTTAVNVVCGLEKAYKGTIKLNGKRLKEYKKGELYRNNVAVLPQDSRIVFTKDTVGEDFNEACDAMEYNEEKRKEKINSLTKTFNIGSLTEKHPYDLSGGEQQKCALAKLLLLEPRIIFLDEPTKGFDSFAKKGLSKIIQDLKEKNITVVIVTHDVEFAAVNADRCAMYFDGEIISSDYPESFFSKNNFYTTAANRMARHMFPRAVTCEEIVELCKINGYRKGGKTF